MAFSSSYEDACLTGLRLSLLQCDHISNNHIFNGPVSKLAHILGARNEDTVHTVTVRSLALSFGNPSKPMLECLLGLLSSVFLQPPPLFFLDLSARVQPSLSWWQTS